jgi:uncharacterized protein
VDSTPPSPGPSPRKTPRAGRAWLALALTVLAIGALIRWVNLTPRVETDFFFSPDDPQPRATEEIGRRFPTGAQVLMRVASPDISSAGYRDLIRSLTAGAREIDQVTSVTSMTTVDVTGPLWGRLLISPDRTASYVLLDVRNDDPTQLARDVESLAARWNTPETDIRISGVPYVLELIRRNLFRDLLVFSSAALVIFGAAAAVVYRRWWIVAGTLASCLVACSGVLLVVQLFHISIGLLTANLATIVFVLTLSHIVFVTSSWRRTIRSAGALQEIGEPPPPLPDSTEQHGEAFAVRIALRETFPASFWSMATTLLGFLSLLFASAKPLRELGVAGAVGSVVAIITAYAMYPAFLGAASIHAPVDGATAQAERGRRAGPGGCLVAHSCSVWRLEPASDACPPTRACSRTLPRAPSYVAGSRRLIGTVAVVRSASSFEHETETDWTASST